MIHTVTAATRCIFEDELLEFRRIDCANSAHMIAWKADDLAQGIGHFYDDHAIHILALENGSVTGGACLTPTSKPHRLGEVFPHLAFLRGVPRDRAFYGIDEPVRMHQASRPSITREIAL